MIKYNAADDSFYSLFDYDNSGTQNIMREIYTNEDETKFLVLGTNYKKVGLSEESNETKLSVFSRSKDNRWTEIQIVKNMVYKSLVKLRFSANFEFVGILSSNVTTIPYPQTKTVAYFVKIDYSTNTAIPVTMPAVFDTLWKDYNSM